MAGRRLVVFGVPIAAAAGYYFYQAGGDPKVAERKFEHDVSKASAQVKDTLPGTAKEAKTEGKLLASQAGSKIDSAINDAKAKTRDVDARLESYRKDAEKSIDANLKSARDSANKAVDKFDKTVEKKTSEAKSGLSGWFGGSK